MNLVCPECKALIFTPSNDTDYHKKLLDGHIKEMHGDVIQKYVKHLTKCIAVLHLVAQQGGLGKDGNVFAKKDARQLINEIQDTLAIPRTAADVDDVPANGVAGVSTIENSSQIDTAATPAGETTKQFVSETDGKSPEQRKKDNRKAANDARKATKAEQTKLDAKNARKK